ncbi:unnamed protein product, partial [Mycena citricolor]
RLIDRSGVLGSWHSVTRGRVYAYWKSLMTVPDVISVLVVDGGALEPFGLCRFQGKSPALVLKYELSI